MRPRIIYIAGPYRAPHRIEVSENILAAKRIGAMVAETQAGYPVIPHANTDGDFGDLEVPDSFWLEATIELMRRCDGVIMLPTWRRSSGATEERIVALGLGLPVLDLEEDGFSEAIQRTRVEAFLGMFCDAHDAGADPVGGLHR